MRAVVTSMLTAACLGLLVPMAEPPAQAAVPRPDEITYTYCVRLDGVDGARARGFADRVAEILSDPDGWGLDGELELRERDRCDTDFTVWLAAPERVADFDEGCGPRWSCRVGPDVVVNAERWDHASEAWDEAGASLAAYRRMVVNHELGHWLGFDHAECPEAGAPAPVMQQQSMRLDGCEPNPLPGAADRAQLAHDLGLDPPADAEPRAGSAPRTSGDPGDAQR